MQKTFKGKSNPYPMGRDCHKVKAPEGVRSSSGKVKLGDRKVPPHFTASGSVRRRG